MVHKTHPEAPFNPDLRGLCGYSFGWGRHAAAQGRRPGPFGPTLSRKER
jgi:hypothetical protein